MGRNRERKNEGCALLNISHPTDGMQPLSFQLMKCVRLPLLSRDFLMSNVDTELLVRHHSECKDLLIEALKYHLMPEQRGVLSNSRTRPRRCEGASTVLFAVGKALPARGLPLYLHKAPAFQAFPRFTHGLGNDACSVCRWGQPVCHPWGLRGLRHADGPLAHGGLHVDPQGQGGRRGHWEQVVRRGRVRGHGDRDGAGI